ncbi:hypothetical protein FRAHR75_90035 [Frankia sp. Hr75.2]|nr:hypothetical protein FRAHR75_90035 [Frankia sp. Hr75.2]
MMRSHGFSPSDVGRRPRRASRVAMGPGGYATMRLGDWATEDLCVDEPAADRGNPSVRRSRSRRRR